MTELRVIVRQEYDIWVAQCVDFDIAAQGGTVSECQSRMADQLMAEAIESEKATGTVFGGIPKAPEEFLEIWNAAPDAGFSATDEIRTSNSSVHVDMRLAG